MILPIAWIHLPVVTVLVKNQRWPRHRCLMGNNNEICWREKNFFPICIFIYLRLFKILNILTWMARFLKNWSIHIVKFCNEDKIPACHYIWHFWPWETDIIYLCFILWKHKISMYFLLSYITFLLVVTGRVGIFIWYGWL